MGFSAVWSNHFESGFHLDDTDAIVENHALRSLGNVPSFYKSPIAYSASETHAEYLPLLTTAFALDHAIAGHAAPVFFQAENLAWFVIELGILYALFRFIPGCTPNGAAFATALFAVHPLMAETLNYALERGVILSSLGVVAGLWLWIVWPRHLPADFRPFTPKVPKKERDVIRARNRPKGPSPYQRIVALGLPFYLVPVILAMFSGPVGVAFVPLLIVYIFLYESGTGLRRVIPSAAICGSIWLFQWFTVFHFSGGTRVPLLSYLWTQPWVAVHYFYSFVVPVRLTGASVLMPFSAPWSPLALVGYAGLAGLIWLALWTARGGIEWRPVSFGLWWFLVALIPMALLPQRQVESYPAMFLASAGLVFALAHIGTMLLDRFATAPRLGLPVNAIGPASALMVLMLCGALTYSGTAVWKTDETLWADVVDKHPKDPYAMMNYGLALMSAGSDDIFRTKYALGNEYLMRASALRPDDPRIETELGKAALEMGRESEAEKHLRRAVQLTPAYAPAFAALGEWMRTHQHVPEAFELASKAVAIDPHNAVALGTLAEVYIDRDDWPNALKVSTAALHVKPEDRNLQRAQNVAGAGIAALDNAVKTAKAEPTTDHYLLLSATYFKDGKFEESIQASREALKIQPDLAEAYFNMAAGYHSLGKRNEGIAALREAVRLKPDLEVAKSNLAWELAHDPANPAR